MEKSHYDRFRSLSEPYGSNVQVQPQAGRATPGLVFFSVNHIYSIHFELFLSLCCSHAHEISHHLVTVI